MISVPYSHHTPPVAEAMSKPESPPDANEPSPGEQRRQSLPSTAVSLDIEAPETILGTLLAGRYRLDEVIGRGGMSVIYRAEHIHMRKAFAVKVLHRELSVLPEVVARFEREAVAAASIDHPNVAAATDFGRLGDGSFYLVLEHIAGRSLAELLARREPLPEGRVVPIIRQIAEALVGAHAQGIVHRDLKPENIMLVERPDDPEFVKVLDFGIAKVSVEPGGPVLTRAGSVFGTPQYMSPEQAGGGQADARSDLYALGILAYEMLSGYPPFDDPDVRRVVMMQTSEFPARLPADCGARLRAFVERLLEKDPERRFQTAHEALEALDAIAREEDRPGEPPRRFRVLLGRIPEQVRIGKLSLTREHVVLLVGGGAALVGLSLLVLLVVALWPDRPAATPAAAPVAEGQEAMPAAVSSVVPKLPREVLVARAAVGDEEALDLLHKRAESSGTAESWLALGRGYARRGQHGIAMRAYEKALERQGTLRNDHVLLRDVRAAAREEASAEAALRVASRLLDSAGADILYDVWVSTAQKTPTTQLAKQLVYDSSVRSKASPSLEVALKLRAAERCQDYERLLSDVILYGDRRVARLVKPLKLTTGCGPGTREDCYPCLRNDAELLETALGESLRRPEPRVLY